MQGPNGNDHICGTCITGNKSIEERGQGMCDKRQDIVRERMNCTYDSMTGCFHLDWDKGEQLYLYMFLRTTCRQRIF